MAWSTTQKIAQRPSCSLEPSVASVAHSVSGRSTVIVPSCRRWERRRTRAVGASSPALGRRGWNEPKGQARLRSRRWGPSQKRSLGCPFRLQGPVLTKRIARVLCTIARVSTSADLAMDASDFPAGRGPAASEHHALASTTTGVPLFGHERHTSAHRPLRAGGGRVHGLGSAQATEDTEADVTGSGRLRFPLCPGDRICFRTSWPFSSDI